MPMRFGGIKSGIFSTGDSMYSKGQLILVTNPKWDVKKGIFAGSVGLVLKTDALQVDPGSAGHRWTYIYCCLVNGKVVSLPVGSFKPIVKKY